MSPNNEIVKRQIYLTFSEKKHKKLHQSMNIDLTFNTKTINIAGSLKNNASLIPKEAYAKGDPPKLVHNVAVLYLETLELNIVKC